MGRRRRRRIEGDVELNLAAMLDMAFQLLAFFILTFKPGAVEGQIALRMPPPQPVTNQADGGTTENSNNAVPAVETLVITALSNADGGIKSLKVAQGEPMTSLPALEERLQEIFADPNLSFEQVILQVGSRMRYEHVMQLLDACVRLKLPSGENLSHLSFVEVPENDDEPSAPEKPNT